MNQINPGTLHSGLLHVFGVAKDAGIIYGNPADGTISH
jgi:hypothetical protein